MKPFITAILLILICSFSYREAADRTIQGTITDASTGKTITGATVSAKGENSSAISDAQGNFTITVSEATRKLVCSFVGYETQEIKITKDQEPLHIKLKATANELDEVVVTGYGSQSDINTENFSPLPYSALQGSAAGIAIGKRSSLRKEKIRGTDPSFNTEEYAGITENRFLQAENNPLSTFSIDVDGASYSNVRRFLQMGQVPATGSVRIEELINYFHYDYPQPATADPFSINTEIADCPWNNHHQLVMIGLQGKKIPMEHLPASNLVFLIDVSGSMMEENKLPLVQSSLKLLVDQLREQDKVAIVVYAGNAGLVLPSTPGTQKQKIRDAIASLEAGGSTAGGAGIQLAYKTAKENFIKGANNRVILCTDGDFNVGASSDAALVSMIEEERKSGVYLTVLGYGMGNYKDSKMEQLADKGNGNHAYIDNLQEARKVLVSEFGGTLFTIAKDVKLQVEFNPAKVQAYRLIGYENRMLNKEDFNNDKKDAGDLGSGHTVTALYELIPAGAKNEFIETTDALKYQRSKTTHSSAQGNELLTIKFRYKKPDGDISSLIEHPVVNEDKSINNTSDNFRFVAAVAEFGMLLTHSEFRQQSDFTSVTSLAAKALGRDEEGYRAEFLSLVKKAQQLTKDEALSSNDR